MAEIPLSVLVPLTLVGGLALWVTGRKLIRWALTTSGLIGGAAGSLAVVQALEVTGNGQYIAVVVGGVVGMVFGWWLYKMLMPAGLAAVFSAAAPLAYLAVFSIPLPPLQLPTPQTGEPASVPSDESDANDIDGFGFAPDTGRDSAPTSPPYTLELNADGQKVISEGLVNELSMSDIPNLPDLPTLPEIAERIPRPDIPQETIDSWSEWWGTLRPSDQVTLPTLAGVAALAGMVFGMLKPNSAASIQTSLAGSGLMMWGAAGLVLLLAPNQADMLPSHPRLVLLILAVLSYAGYLFQGWLWGKVHVEESAKKKDEDEDD